MVDKDDEYEIKTIKFELNTDDLKCLVFKIMSDTELDGDDLIQALEKLMELLRKDQKNAREREPHGH